MVHIFKSEVIRIVRYTYSRSSIEIGGDLFGFYSPVGQPIICVATGPGPEAKLGHDYFLQDPDFQVWSFGILVNQYRLLFLGEWHSHHSLRSSEPSQSDTNRLLDLSQKNKWPHLCSIILQTHGRKSDPGTELRGIYWNVFRYDFSSSNFHKKRTSIQVSKQASAFSGLAEQLHETYSVKTKSETQEKG